MRRLSLSSVVTARAERAQRMHGVRLRAGHDGSPAVEVDPQFHGAAQADVLAHYLQGESLAATFQGQGKAATVTEQDLRIINERHSGDELTADDIRVFERYSANDVLMRRPLRFTKAALEKLAADAEQGRTVLIQHDTQRYFGRVFAGTVEEATVRGVTANWLVTRLYAVTKGASEARLQDISDVAHGIIGFDSVTVAGGDWTFVEVEGPEDADGNRSHHYHYEVDDNEGAPRPERLELRELSMVHLGAVDGAGSNTTKNEAPAQPTEKSLSTEPPSSHTDSIVII